MRAGGDPALDRLPLLGAQERATAGHGADAGRERAGDVAEDDQQVAVLQGTRCDALVRGEQPGAYADEVRQGAARLERLARWWRRAAVAVGERGAGRRDDAVLDPREVAVLRRLEARPRRRGIDLRVAIGSCRGLSTPVARVADDVAAARRECQGAGNR